ncbi:MAG: SusC/RagA family TonB-linked outer membrane protein [Flavobacteriaceae bacterium]
MTKYSSKSIGNTKFMILNSNELYLNKYYACLKKSNLKLCIILICAVFPLGLHAQDAITITGAVTSNGEPLLGVTIQIQGSLNGTTTDFDGNYGIEAVSSDILVFTSLGFQSEQETIGGRTVINVELKEDAAKLDEVVVTALGITREKKALGYAFQEVGESDFNVAKEVNVMNALAGKISGVQITRGPGGPAASTRVVIRGNSSLTGNNQPLYVVDGVPINNSTVSQGGIDYGGGINDINPEDIASISVLKGPNAAALYGARGQNGVIIVTTKSGIGQKGIGLEFTSNTTFENIALLPDYQNEWGQGKNGTIGELNEDGIPNLTTRTDESWGGRIEGQPYLNWDRNNTLSNYTASDVKGFFNTAVTQTNTIALSGGNESANFRLSLTDVDYDGILPNTTFDRQSVNLNISSKLTEDLVLNAKANYITHSSVNRPLLGNKDLQKVTRFVYRIPRTVHRSQLIPVAYPESNQEWDPQQRDGDPVTWNNSQSTTNPYWDLYNNPNTDSRSRLIGLLGLNYQAKDWLNFMVRTGLDRYNTKAKRRIAQQSRGTNNRFKLGSLFEQNLTVRELNVDFLIKAEHSFWQEFNVSLSFGGNHLSQETESLQNSGFDFIAADNFSLSNLNITDPPIPFVSNREVNSLYAFGQIAYKDYLYVDLSVRNDWSSTLPVSNNSIFYPAVSSSFVFTDAFNLSNDILSFGKLRFSLAEVGNDTDPYQLNPVFSINSNGYNNLPFASQGTLLPAVDLKPELTRSIEFGADLRFFKNRIGVDFSWYKSKTTNQIIEADVSRSSGFTRKIFNAGEIQNDGIEVSLDADIFDGKDFKWNTTVNFAKNNSLVVSLLPNEKSVILGFGPRPGSSIQAIEGQPYGVIVGKKYRRDPLGRIVVDRNGLVASDGEIDVIGNFTPDWIGGIRNMVSYKNLSLSFLVDVKMGGDVLSQSEWILPDQGLAKESAQGREAWYESEANRFAAGILNPNLWTPTGGVFWPNTAQEVRDASGNVVGFRQNDRFASPEPFWDRLYDDNIAEFALSDASFVKLREVTLTYNLPVKILSKLPFTGLSFSLTGRNLWIIHKNTKHIDPETNVGSGNGQQGLEFFQQPSTRSIGFNLSMKF